MATSNIAYQINYSNQGRIGYAGSVDNFFTIAPLKTNIDQPTLFDAANNQIAPTPLSLVFTGYRNPEYGQAMWTNMLQLLENFASPTKPLNPVLGQLWFNKSSELGALQVCTDPVNSIWSNVNSRIFIGSVPPIVSGPTLWYNQDNRGLFFWDTTLTTTTTTATPPFTTIDPTGPVDITGHPSIHSQVGLAIGAKWVNVLYHRYAAVTEYNSLTTQFAAWNMAGRPEILPTSRQPTDVEWLALFAYVKQYGDALVPAVDTSTLVPTVFKYYSTDRFGFQLLQQYYDALVGVCTAIFNQLAINQTPVPVAAFDTSLTQGVAPMVVAFVDNSVHAVGATYLWNFGDGTTSTQVGSVSHTYLSAGLYTATLTVTNISGTSTHSSVLRATVTPTSNFTYTPSIGSAPLTVAFTDQSMGSPTSWLWDFGDGTTSSVQNPTHVFIDPGTYTLTLTATNYAGSHSVSQTVTVTPAATAVTSTFTVDQSAGTAPLTVVFTDTSTGSPTVWLWDFGDGTTSTAPNPIHTFNTVGTYTVTLTAQNSLGGNQSSPIVITVVV